MCLMGERRVPELQEIRELISKVDKVCREAEHIRAQSEQSHRRPATWPHDPPAAADAHDPDSDDSSDR